MNSWKEVFNYGNALRKGQQLLNEELPISLRLIRELHNQLLSGVRGHHRDPGNFRRSQVHIGSDRRFVPPPPNETIDCLNNLEKYIHSEKKIDPLVFCFLVHYQFETIHPFLDGNGRVGRLLLSLMIYKWCNLTSPWLYLSAFFDKLVALRETYLKKITGCKGSIRLHKIIDKLFESPAVNIPQLSKLFGITYPTASHDVDIMIRNSILVEGKFSSRPKTFFSPEIIQIAYKDIEMEDQ